MGNSRHIVFPKPWYVPVCWPLLLWLLPAASMWCSPTPSTPPGGSTSTPPAPHTGWDGEWVHTGLQEAPGGLEALRGRWWGGTTLVPVVRTWVKTVLTKRGVTYWLKFWC